MYKKWTLKELDILKNNYRTKVSEDLIVLLPNKTLKAIQTKAFRLKLTCLTPRQRFWRQVDKKQNDLCWNWTGYCNNSGYGQFQINKTMVLVHRFSYELFFGKIPENKPCICHTCDNPKCVNPGHLFSGTNQDNIDDRNNKNRQTHKFTMDQIKEIKSLLQQKKLTQTQIAKIYNVSLLTISRVHRNKIRRYV